MLSEMNRNRFIVVPLLLILLSVGLLFPCISLAQNKNVLSAPSTLIAKHRPRVVYFYTDWCEVCQAYGPALKKTVAAFNNYIDLQSFNIEDHRNRKVVTHFKILVVPTTYIYNTNGQRVFAKTGSVDQLIIYRVLNEIYKELSSPPAKIVADKQSKQGHAVPRLQHK